MIKNKNILWHVKSSKNNMDLIIEGLREDF